MKVSSKEQAIEIVKNRIKDLENIYHLGLLNPKKIIDIVGENIGFLISSEKAWIFFSDLSPEANWEHDCLYILVDEDSGDFECVIHNWPPADDLLLEPTSY